ncbi:distal tail protein Dit, partial [Virgibacillus kimchii]
MLRGRLESPYAPIRHGLIRVPGMSGVHVSSTDTDELYVYQPVGFKVEDENHEQELLDELKNWLIKNEDAEIQFDNVPGKTYIGRVTGEITDYSRPAPTLRSGTLVFLCKPFKYGPERSQLLTADTAIIENPGTTEADPIFEMEVLEPVTFAMVSNGEEYNLIGKPVEEEGNEEIVDEKVSVLYENGSTVDEWEISSPDHVDEHANDIDGRMVGDPGVGIRADSYGTGNRMHGPAITRELPEAIQDFEISSVFDIISRREIENFRMEIYFHDENM